MKRLFIDETRRKLKQQLQLTKTKRLWRSKIMIYFVQALNNKVKTRRKASNYLLKKLDVVAVGH